MLTLQHIPKTKKSFIWTQHLNPWRGMLVFPEICFLIRQFAKNACRWRFTAGKLSSWKPAMRLVETSNLSFRVLIRSVANCSTGPLSSFRRQLIRATTARRAVSIKASLEARKYMPSLKAAFNSKETKQKTKSFHLTIYSFKKSKSKSANTSLLLLAHTNSATTTAGGFGSLTAHTEAEKEIDLFRAQVLRIAIFKRKTCLGPIFTWNLFLKWNKGKFSNYKTKILSVSVIYWGSQDRKSSQCDLNFNKVNS